MKTQTHITLVSLFLVTIITLTFALAGSIKGTMTFGLIAAGFGIHAALVHCCRKLPLILAIAAVALPASADTIGQRMSFPIPLQAEPPNRNPVVVGVVCVVGAVVIVGWVGWRIWDHWEDVQLNHATNPAPRGAVIGGQTGCDSHGYSPLGSYGDPLPIEVDYSPDGEQWSSVASGVRAGMEYYMPSTGYARARLISLTIERTDSGAILHAPPGRLERSMDLVTWETVQVNYMAADIIAEAGMFYRVTFYRNREDN